MGSTEPKPIMGAWGFAPAGSKGEPVGRGEKAESIYRATCNATHGIAVAILSVCLSVCVSVRCVACIVTKLNDTVRIF